MSSWYIAYFGSLGLSALASFGLAGLLWRKAGTREGIIPLVWFCVGTGVWAIGLLCIHLGSQELATLGQGLVNVTPAFVSALLLHFSLVFTGRSTSNGWRIFLYGLCILTGGGSALFQAGRLEPWLEFSRFYILSSPIGIINAVLAVVLTFGAHSILGHHIWQYSNAVKQKQCAAVLLATLGGLGSSSGLLFPVLELSWFPFPMLLLPSYTCILVFGILRYEFMEVNIWARRSMAATLLLIGLLGIMSIGVAITTSLGWPPLGGVSLGHIWAFTLIVVLLAAGLRGPMSALAAKLIYPGGKVNSEILDTWRRALEQVQTWDELQSVGAALLSQHLQQSVQVFFNEDAQKLSKNALGIQAISTAKGWECRLLGWKGSAPAIQQTGEVFCALLSAATTRLEQARAIAEREKEILAHEHLTELGKLSATVAHEIRNPLNIIGVAAAKCPIEVKQEILEQVRRANRLTEDLLSYTGTVSISPKWFLLKDFVEYLFSHYRSTPLHFSHDIASDLKIYGDISRIQQVFINLLDNATAALQDHTNPMVNISAKQNESHMCLTICDNGPGIPVELRDRIFQAFVSARPGGHGLGLAIARRIMEAHDGTVALSEANGWPCCIELTFPMKGKA